MHKKTLSGLGFETLIKIVRCNYYYFCIIMCVTMIPKKIIVMIMKIIIITFIIKKFWKENMKTDGASDKNTMVR